MAKTGLDRYSNKEETLKKRAEYNKAKYKRFTLTFDVEQDKDIIKFLNEFGNNTQAFRMLYNDYKKTTK